MTSLLAPADTSWQYPDVVHLVHHFFATSQEMSSFIVDAEIVAIDNNGDSLKSFQELSNRHRKDVKLHEIKVSVCVYAFDLMYLNGQVSANQYSIHIKHNLVILGSHFSKTPFVAGENSSALTFWPYGRTKRALPDSIMLKAARVRKEGKQSKNFGSARSRVAAKV